jgi:hypothetical protein
MVVWLRKPTLFIIFQPLKCLEKVFGNRIWFLTNVSTSGSAAISHEMETRLKSDSSSQRALVLLHEDVVRTFSTRWILETRRRADQIPTVSRLKEKDLRTSKNLLFSLC